MLIENAVTLEQLASAYGSGQRVFRSMEIAEQGEQPSLSGLNLSDAQFIDCWFHSATFRRVDLARARFQGCNLKCTTFVDCNLCQSTWDGCAVCSLAVVASHTEGVQATKLAAYGATIPDAAAFLAYAVENGKRISQAKAPPNPPLERTARAERSV